MSSNPGDFPVFIMKSSLFSKGFANGPPKWRHFEQDCHHGHRNGNTSLGGKEEDAFLPSFRHTQIRGQETSHLLLASLYIKMLLQAWGTRGRDKEMSGLRTWNCLPPPGWCKWSQPEAVQSPHTGKENSRRKMLSAIEDQGRCKQYWLWQTCLSWGRITFLDLLSVQMTVSKELEKLQHFVLVLCQPDCCVLLPDKHNICYLNDISLARQTSPLSLHHWLGG